MSIQKNRRILLIDDQVSMHDDYRKVIGRPRPNDSSISQAAVDLFGADDMAPTVQDGFEVDSAYQGEDGFLMVQQALEEGRPYALAFVDVRMPPGWDGIETVRHIWDVDPEILIVICSAYSDYSWDQTVERLGESDRFLILKKPFEPVEIRQFAVALTERWNMARNDVLTGLLNRRAFAEHLHREHSRALRHGSELSCVMLDLDYFKRINDEFGHCAGDSILRTVAGILKETSRASDYLCRFGGEEFCALLPLTDAQEAAAWADKCRSAIAELKIDPHKDSLKATLSAGAATLVSGETPETLVEHADTALRMAKQRGRNRVFTYNALPVPGDAVESAALLDSPLNGVYAAEVMVSPIVQLEEHATIDEAARMILACHVSSIAVVDDDEKLTGVISEREIMAQMLLPGGKHAAVGKLMGTNVACYAEDAPLDRIFDFLSRVTISQVFVVRDGRPIGAITRSGLLRWLSGWLTRGDETTSEADGEAFEEARIRVREAAEDLARRASALAEDTISSGSIPPLVDVMFKMQELINELSLCSRRTWAAMNPA